MLMENMEIITKNAVNICDKANVYKDIPQKILQKGLNIYDDDTLNLFSSIK